MVAGAIRWRRERQGYRLCRKKGGKWLKPRAGLLPGGLRQIVAAERNCSRQHPSNPLFDAQQKEFSMQAQLHTMSNLFAQLGLPAEDAAVEQFIAAHRPLDNDIALYRAPFWSAMQRDFLKEEIIEDADWSSVIDELNGRLR
jgi:hypothetical protein